MAHIHLLTFLFPFFVVCLLFNPYILLIPIISVNIKYKVIPKDRDKLEVYINKTLSGIHGKIFGYKKNEYRMKCIRFIGINALSIYN